jgi:hypothetical protein
MAGKTNYLETKTLEHNVGKTSFTAPSDVYLALCTSDPGEAATGAGLAEATYTGYARLLFDAADWDAAVSGAPSSIQNNGAKSFAACTAGSSTITHWALCDSSGTGTGNVLYFGTVTSVTISTTQTPATVPDGALVITED